MRTPRATIATQSSPHASHAVRHLDGMHADARREPSVRVGTSHAVRSAASAPDAGSQHDQRERAISALASRQHGVVTTRQLVSIGFSKGSIAHRERQDRLHRVHRGVYAVGHGRLTTAGRQMAAALACGEGVALSHVSAAGPLGLLGEHGGTVHVTALPGNGSASRSGVRVHRGRALEARDVTHVDVRPVTTVARTLVDLGDVVSPAYVRRAFVRAEQARAIDMTAIDHVLARAGRRRGPAILRALLAVYDPRWHDTRSELELAMLDLAERSGLPEPNVNEWLLGRFLVDFLWRDARLIVETDGREFHATATARRDDARRDHALRRAGFRVMRVSYRSVISDQANVASRIAAALRAGSDLPRATWDR